MTPDIDILNQMIKDSARLHLSQHQNNLKVELTEPLRPDSTAKVYGLPNNTVVIRADAFTSPDAGTGLVSLDS